MLPKNFTRKKRRKEHVDNYLNFATSPSSDFKASRISFVCKTTRLATHLILDAGCRSDMSLPTRLLLTLRVFSALDLEIFCFSVRFVCFFSSLIFSSLDRPTVVMDNDGFWKKEKKKLKKIKPKHV